MNSLSKTVFRNHEPYVLKDMDNKLLNIIDKLYNTTIKTGATNVGSVNVDPNELHVELSNQASNQKSDIAGGSAHNDIPESGITNPGAVYYGNQSYKPVSNNEVKPKTTSNSNTSNKTTSTTSNNTANNKTPSQDSNASKPYNFKDALNYINDNPGYLMPTAIGQTLIAALLGRLLGGKTGMGLGAVMGLLASPLTASYLARNNYLSDIAKPFAETEKGWFNPNKSE